MDITCKITPELKSKMLTSIIAYLDSHQNTNPETLCQDIIKDIWDSGNFKELNSDQRYFIKNALSLIPFIIKNNILTKNSDGTFNEGIKEEYYNRFDRKSIERLINDFSYVKEGPSDKNPDWLKNISFLVGDLRGSNKTSNTRGENELKKADAINREEEILKLKLYMEISKEEKEVNSNDIKHGDEILVISKGGILIPSKCESIEGDSIIITGSSDSLSNVIKINSTTYPILDVISNSILAYTNNALISPNDIFEATYNKTKNTFEIKCGNKICAEIPSADEPLINLMKLATVGKNRLLFKANEKLELESYTPQFAIRQDKIIKRTVQEIKEEKDHIEESKNNPFENMSPIMAFNAFFIDLYRKEGIISDMSPEQIKIRKFFTENVGTDNIVDKDGNPIKVFLKGEKRKAKDQNIKKEIVVLVACDENGNTLYFKPQGLTGKILASSDESMKDENKTVVFNIDPLTTKEDNYPNVSRRGIQLKEKLDNYIKENNIQDEQLINGALDYIKTLYDICSEISKSNNTIIFEITDAHVIVRNDYNASASREIRDNDSIEYKENIANIIGGDAIYNTPQSSAEVLQGVAKLLSEELIDEFGSKIKPELRNGIINFLFTGGIFYNGTKYYIKELNDELVLSSYNEDGTPKNVLVKYESNGDIEVINKNELSNLLNGLLNDTDNSGYCKIKFRLNNRIDKETEFPYIDASGKISKLKISKTAYLNKLGMRVVNPKENRKIDCNVSFKFRNSDIASKSVATELNKKEENANDVTDDQLNLFKSIETKLSSDPSTSKQIEQAKEWFKNSPLSKVIGFEEAFNMVHSKAVAKWTLNGIVLMQGSDYTDLYHESWHAFSQTFLTKEEKKDLYESLTRKNGSFKDEHNNTVKFSEASYKQLEEYLAEGFRTYMLNRKSYKESGIILKVFKKIWNVLKSLFSKSNTVSDLYEKLAIGDIAKWTQDRGNIMFDELHRSIDLLNGEGSMSSKRTYDISELMSIYMSDYLMLDSTREYIDFRYLPYINRLYDQMTSAYNNGELKTTEDRRNKLSELKSELVKEISERFNIEIDEAKSIFNDTISNKFGKSLNEASQLNVDVKSISEFFTDESRIRNAYSYSLVRLSKLRNDIAKKIVDTDDVIEKIKLQEQYETISLAIENYGDINKFNNESQNKGVIAFHFNETFNNIEIKENEDVEGEEDQENAKIQDADEIETSDPDVTNPNRGNAQSAEQRMKSDSLMKFLLSTIPSYVINVDIESETPFQYVSEKNEYGERKIKDFKKIKNRLTTLLQGCPDVSSAYKRLMDSAYKEDGKTIKDPIISAIVKRLGDPNSISNLQDRSMQQKSLLWVKFWQVFACPEVPLYETDIVVTRETEIDPNGQLIERIKNIRTNVGEMSGPKWKMNDHYKSGFKTSGAPLKMTQKGLAIDFEKLNDKYNLENFDIDLITTYYDESSIYGFIYNMLHDLGLSVSANEDCIKEIVNEIFYGNTTNTIVFLKDVMLEQLLYQRSYNDPIIDPVSQLFGYTVTRLTDIGKKDAYNSNNYSIYESIKMIDMKYTDSINTEMVKNAEGSVLFMNQLNNSITQLLNKINSNEIKTYDDVLNDPALKHFDIREYIELYDGTYIENPNYNPNLEGSSFIENIFDIQIENKENVTVKRLNGETVTKNITLINSKQSIRSKDGLKINLVNLSGVKTKVQQLIKGEITPVEEVASSLFQADKNTKALADLILFAKGNLQEFMRHADKGVSYGFKLRSSDGVEMTIFKGWNKLIMNDDQLKENIYETFIKDYFVSYLHGEIKRVVRVRELQQLREKNPNIQFDHKYLDSSESLKLGVFDDILSKNTKNIINKNIDKIVKGGGDFDFESIKSGFIEDVFNYYQSVNDENYNVFKDALSKMDTNARDMLLKELLSSKFGSNINAIKDKDGIGFSFVSDNEGNNITTFGEDFNEFALKNIVNLFTASNIIYNIECLKFIYGDAMIYNHKKDDFTKRIGGMGSTGSVFNDDIWMRNVLDKMSETSYSKALFDSENTEQNAEYSEPYRNGEHEGELKTAICADIHPLSAYAKEYNAISNKYQRIEEESNAQGLISFDSYRYMCMREGKWDEHKEELFQKICKISTGESNETISNEDVVKFFPILKLQFEGPLNNNYIPLQAFHKYALMPIIPTMVKDKNLELVHKRMIKEGIDYITFNSGCKLSVISNGKKSLDSSGNVTQYGDQLYEIDQKNGEYKKEKSRIVNSGITNGEEDYFTPNYIPIAYIKDQVEIHEELDEDTIFSTQMRRLMNNNFYEDGVPVDFREKHSDKSIEDVISLWNSLSKEEKLKRSDLYALDNEYTNAMSKLTELAIRDIKKEFGMNKKGEFNQEKFLKYIKKELKKKGIPEYVIENITSIQQLQFGNYAKEVEKIVISLINKRVIKQHVHGGQFVQVASTLFETQNQFLEEETEGTNDLLFYGIGEKKEYKKNQISVVGYNENGELNGIEPATIKIPLAGDFVNLLQSYMYDEDGNKLEERVGSIENLNKMLKKQSWVDEYLDAISIVACRIPVQGHNSIENYRIAEFLNPGCNNIIICPSELVIKSGGDYDVDKLSTILPHIRMIGDEVFVPGKFEEKDRNEFDAFKKTRDILREEVDKKRYRYYTDVLKKLRSLEIHGDKNHTEYQDKAISILNKIDEYETKINKIKETMKSDLTSDKDKIKLQENLNKLYSSLDSIYMNDVPKAFEELYNEENKGSIDKGDRDHVSFAGAKNSMNEYIEEKDRLKKFEKNEFSKMEMNDSQFGLENALLKSMVNILKNKINTKTLLMPNQTDVFLNKAKDEKDMAPANVLKANADYDRFHRKNGEENGNMSPTRIIEYRYNLEKHDDLNTGKTILGPAAIDNVFAPISKKAGIVMNQMSSAKKDITEINFKESDWDKLESYDLKNEETLRESTIKKLKDFHNKKYGNRTDIEAQNHLQLTNDLIRKIGEYRKQEIYLPHNTINKNGNEVINLSHVKDKLGYNEISEVISEYMNGCVDVAKDAWIKYVQGNREAIPTFMFMIQAGIPAKHACYFISNPKIVEYIQAKTNDKSAIESINPSVKTNKALMHRASLLNVDTSDGYTKNGAPIPATMDIVRARINDKINQIIDSGDKSKFSDENYLKSRAISKEQSEDDLQILAHFFMIEDMATAMNALKLGIRVDASKSNTFYDLIQRQSKFGEISENERLDPESLIKIQNDSILSSFFIEEFAMDLVKSTLPIYSDPLLSSTFENIILPEINRSGVDASRSHDDFYNRFKSFLYQMSFKTTNDDSFVNNDRIDIGNKYEETAMVSKSTKNNICKLISEEFGENQKTKTERLEEIKKSRSFQEWANINSSDAENYQDESELEKFAIMTKLMNSAYKTSSFIKNDYNIGVRFGVIKAILEKDPITSKLIAGYSLFDNLSIEKFGDETHLIISREIDDKSKEILYEEYKRLVSSNDDFSLISILSKSNMSDYDKKYIMDFFNSLPYISIAQSGMNSNRGSMNLLFDPSSFIFNEYTNFINSDDKTKIDIIEKFSTDFKTNILDSNKSHCYDNFDSVSSKGFMIINHDPFVNTSNPKSPQDFADNSGGAYGADHFGGEIGEEYGLGVQRHFRIPSEANPSGGTNTAYGQKEIQNKNQKVSYDEYSESRSSEKGVFLIQCSNEQLSKAEEVYKQLNIKNLKFPNGNNKELVLRNFYQVINSTGIYCFSSISEDRTHIEDGGTSWAEDVAKKVRNQDGTFKSIYVFDAEKNQWFFYDYINQRYKETNTPTLTKNFAIIGTRDSESYKKKNGNNWEETDNKYNYETRCAIRDLYEKTFKINRNGKPLLEKIKSMTNITRSRVVNQQEVLFIYDEGYFRKSQYNDATDQENFVSSKETEKIKQLLESGRYRKIVTDVNGYENVSISLSKASTNEVEQIEPQKPCTQINTQNNKVEIGDIVEYNGSTYLLWNINDSGFAQLIDMNLNKFSGTPKIENLKYIKKSRSVVYDNTKYFVTKDNRIVSSKSGKIVYQEESINRNKILANLEVQEKKAVVVEYNDSKYVVNDKNDIISVTTGKKMNWTEEDANRISILELAKEAFDKINGTIQESKNENPSAKQLSLNLEEEIEEKDESKDVTEVKAFEYKNTTEERYISDSEGKRYTVLFDDEKIYDKEKNVVYVNEKIDKIEDVLQEDVIDAMKRLGINISKINNDSIHEKQRIVAMCNLNCLLNDVISIENEDTQASKFLASHLQTFKYLGYISSIESSLSEEEEDDIKEIEKYYSESFGKGFHFNEEQKRAIIDQSDFIIKRLRGEASTKDYCAITGQAGTGKTTVAKAVIMRIEKYNGEFKKGDIIMGATAGKATTVLRNSISSSELASRVRFMNVASMTDKIISSELGKRTFVKGELGKNLIGSKLIIIDECSMVSNEDLKDILENKPKDSVVMFLGDVGQLPPVRDNSNKNELSPSFTGASIVSSLLKRERQGEENPLLSYSDAFYLDVNNKEKTGNGISKAKGNKKSTEGAIMFTSGTYSSSNPFNIDPTLMTSILKSYINAIETGNPNYIQYISYTIESARIWNELIHKLIFREDTLQYHVGEPIIFKDPYIVKSEDSDSKTKKIEKSTIFTIKKLSDPINYKFTSTLKIGRRAEDVKTIELNIEYKEATLSNGNVVLIPSDNEEFKKAVDEVAKVYVQALNIAPAEQKKKIIDDYNDNIYFKFANTDFAYGLNVHQSQGSTYDIVIVDEGNIDAMKNIIGKEGVYRAKYTALTRSRNIVISLNRGYNNNETNLMDINTMNRSIDSIKSKESDEEGVINFLSKSAQLLYGQDNSILNISQEEVDAEKAKC